MTSRMGAWWLAARPKTLAAGLAPVLVGTAIAHIHGGIAWGPAIACMLGSLLIQIATNLANDYFDHKQGADTEDRLGPARAVQQGWITPKAMLSATVFVLILALCVGLYLISVGGWPIAVIGVTSLVCAVAYTGGPMPLAYVGLGDIFVLAFLGWQRLWEQPGFKPCPLLLPHGLEDSPLDCWQQPFSSSTTSAIEKRTNSPTNVHSPFDLVPQQPDGNTR